MLVFFLNITIYRLLQNTTSFITKHLILKKQEESYKKDDSAHLMDNIMGSKTKQILMSAFTFLQNLNYPKTINILFNKSFLTFINKIITFPLR